MDWKLEVIVVPVSDVDRAKEFYIGKLGFREDVDFQGGPMRVVQVTPPGSGCSITFGTGMTQATPGSYAGMHLVVDDIEAAREHLVDAGVEVSEPFHFGAEGQTTGLHPERASYGTYLSFNDPDGNGWVVQEVKARNPDR
jgi:catechol 2,3-dioxygenase-like lactoylglutathione lyase family enzyme